MWHSCTTMAFMRFCLEISNDWLELVVWNIAWRFQIIRLLCMPQTQQFTIFIYYLVIIKNCTTPHIKHQPLCINNSELLCISSDILKMELPGSKFIPSCYSTYPSCSEGDSAETFWLLCCALLVNGSECCSLSETSCLLNYAGVWAWEGISRKYRETTSHFRWYQIGMFCCIPDVFCFYLFSSSLLCLPFGKPLI